MGLKICWYWFSMILMSVGIGIDIASAEFCGRCDIQPDPDRYRNPGAGLCLINKTNHHIEYEFRWGNEPWENYSLAPHQLKPFYWKYNLDRTNVGNYDRPVPSVRFDEDLSDGSRYDTFNLDTRVVDLDTSVENERKCHDNSIEYIFRYSVGSTRWLRLGEN